MMQIEPEKMYSRASLARALGIPYHTLYTAERRGEIPAPGLSLWRRRFYSPPELTSIIAWVENRGRCAK